MLWCPVRRGAKAHIEGLLMVVDLCPGVAVQNDDKISIIAGYASGLDGHRNGLLARLNQDGSIDGDFNDGTPLLILSLNERFVLPIICDPTGRQNRRRGQRYHGGYAHGRYERVSNNGDIEAFGVATVSVTVPRVTIQPGGRVVVSGSSGPSLTALAFQ